jgi:hypothetical protein
VPIIGCAGISSGEKKVKAHLRRQPAPLGSLRHELPARLIEIVERMMAKDPAARFQSPREVAEEVSAWSSASELAALRVGGVKC